MVHRIVRSLSRFIKHATAFLTCRDARIARWAAGAFSEKRILWNSARLSGCAHQMEQCFLRISTALEGLAGRSSTLVEGSRRLLQISQGRHGDVFVFQAAVDVMERPLDFNEECLEITARVDADLESVAARIGRLDRFQSKLDASLAPLRILEIMFRIESASARPEILTLFVSLSSEIARLMEQMATLIAREFEAIECTAATVGDVVARVRQLHSRQRGAQRRRGEIQSSMAALGVQIEEDKVRDQRLIRASESILGKISGMVGALQYQDILNQRLQHVIEAFAEMAEQSRALTSGSSGDVLCFMRDASRVEAAQLEGVFEALGDTMERLHVSLAGLAEEARGVGAGSAAGADGSAADRMVRVLLDTIQENTELIESTLGQTAAIRAALEPIGGLLGNLTGSILKLSARIRLISLNAQIQAAQAGEGTGLEILACRARTIAEEIVAQVAELAAELEDLKHALAADVEQIAATQTRSAEFLRLLREDGGRQGAVLRRCQDQMLAERRSVVEHIEQIQAESASLSDSLSVRSALLEILGATRTGLQQFSVALSARLTHRNTGTRIEGLARSYTAASEQAAHHRALSADPVAVMGQPVPALAEGSIELF
jgi:hypothetical protein